MKVRMYFPKKKLSIPNKAASATPTVFTRCLTKATFLPSIATKYTAIKQLLAFGCAALILTITGCGRTDQAVETAQAQPNAQAVASANADTTDQANNHLASSLHVVSPDWGVAATLTAMGQPPIATGDTRVWDQWVDEPKLPDSVYDLGIRYLPNAELAAQLPADLIIDNFFYEHSRGVYGDVPAQSVMFASQDDTAQWSDYAEPTRELGTLIDNPAQAERYIDESQRRIAQAAKQLQQRYPAIKKFAVVQFVDANNMRMYAKNSLFNAVLKQMDRQLVALNKGNDWGFVPIQMGDLTQLDPDVCLLVIKPLNPITQQQIQDSLVWQRLGYGANPNTSTNSRCMTILPPIWIYGGMASLTSLAENLASATLVGGRTHDIK